jgi:glycosyltransferase involved in cell wall biosynthesis
MSRLRIAMVAPTLDILGGHSVQAARLLAAWRDDPDVEAWLVPINPRPPAALRAALDVKYLRTVVTEATYLPLLVRELARADVVHIFSASYSSFLLAPLPAILVAKALGTPVLLNYRSGMARDHLKCSAVARKTIAAVDRNIVPSRFLVEVFARFGIKAGIIPNIVDFERFVFRERRPLRPRLLSTRNFDAVYNVAMTIRAFRLVQDRWPDASLTLVGGGAQEPRLRALVAELGLRHVDVVGRVKTSEIAEHYAANEIYVQSPNVDNMPTSAIEAYASGLPVVSTEAGGVPAILTHGEHGLLAPLGDAETLARHVLRLLDDQVFAARLARNAFESCQRCAWRNVRSEWLSAYQSILRKTTTSGARGLSAGAQDVSAKPARISPEPDQP